MLIALWQRFKQQAIMWREVALPGLMLIVIVMLVRWAGLLQVQELMAFDSLSRRCPPATAESAIVIVGIDEVDLKAIGGFPISDRILVDLLTTLQRYNPAVIGLDLSRDLFLQPESDALSQILSHDSQLIGAEIALNSEPSLNIKPLPMLPSDRVGFVDVTIDEDGKLRRSILASLGYGEQELKYSFALQLVRSYLTKHHLAQHISFQPGSLANAPIQIDAFELEPLHSNSGGYVRADVSNHQRLLNFCASQRLFPTLSMTNVLQRNFASNLIRDRIVIVGMTAPSVKDVFFTSALRETLSSRVMSKLLPGTQLIYGVEVQAHATNQIVNVIGGEYPELRVWSDPGEYGWITLWGLLGIMLGILLQSPWKSLLSLIAATAILLGISFLALTLGWWIPLVPAELALGGAGLITTFFDRDLRFELEYRRIAIERIYEAVHNGPLQHLAVILRNLNGDNSPEHLQHQLKSLNIELRNIFEHMRQAMLTRSDRLYLRENLILDLQAPISELLYQVYNSTLEAQIPGFAKIQTYISPNFEILRRSHFSIEQKRGLCLFLQEALWNVGNHAIGATRLDVVCIREANNYALRIIDNGFGIPSTREGQGTKQAKMIAWGLGGRFQRRSHKPKGTICELIFPIQRNWLKRLRQIQ